MTIKVTAAVQIQFVLRVVTVAAVAGGPAYFSDMASWLAIASSYVVGGCASGKALTEDDSHFAAQCQIAAREETFGPQLKALCLQLSPPQRHR